MFEGLFVSLGSRRLVNRGGAKLEELVGGGPDPLVSPTHPDGP
jgi:hypothetical protein